MILDEHCSRKGLLLGSVFLNILDEICEYGRLRYANGTILKSRQKA